MNRRAMIEGPTTTITAILPQRRKEINMSELLENFEGELMFPKIQNDDEAEECIQAIKAAEADVVFWKNYYAEALQKIADASQRIIDNNTARLEAYFDTLPHKVAKTQESYPLPSGKLVRKHQDPEYEYRLREQGDKGWELLHSFR